MKGIKFIFSCFLLLGLSSAFATNPEVVPGEYVVKVKNINKIQKNIKSFEKELNIKIKRFIKGTD